MCETWEPPDGGWDPMVPGGSLLVLNPIEDDEEIDASSTRVLDTERSLNN